MVSCALTIKSERYCLLIAFFAQVHEAPSIRATVLGRSPFRVFIRYAVACSRQATI